MLRRLADRLVDAEQGHQLVDAGDGERQLAVERPALGQPQGARPGGEDVALLDARPGDVEPAVRGRDLAHELRQRLRREVADPAQRAGDVGVDRRIPDARNGDEQRLGQRERDVDRRRIVRQARGGPNVQLGMVGAPELLGVEPPERRLVEHERDALRQC